MRKAPVATERWLWRILRDRQVDGLKFRRQVPLGPYIADFACMRHRIVIEADGPFHDLERDARRDLWLQARGFRTVRLTNAEILADPENLLRRIRALTDAPLAFHPSPLAGEGVGVADG
jgi:very-short-patch-repair endonuclease